MTTQDETVTKVHAFEAAGLGKAPFKFVGYEKKTFQACPGAPIQVGGSCDYCATGICHMYYIKGSDGKTFKVGSECVAKTGDKGLRKVIDAKVAEIKRTELHARQDEKIARANELLTWESVRTILIALPHPRWGTRGTFLDYVLWMMKNGGRTGKCKAAKLIQDAIASKE